ncbi:hypothetical protein JRO89_XS05G0050200 [Xanthoceras sorbifolium]|uniref:Uncharacterized protein n=1 Tax=Xanthoceras sorbifolium TaxID=99658 RepID=A0ABQ8I130_9ROSI|nr:hypothetical protein JRO89_XS05G0050200 [Xanthoceras sorbifolium]
MMMNSGKVERHLLALQRMMVEIGWYTYLNSDFKKGGWSPEEDMLLCEAQKIFGNRWTEIAKVVSGRTDNAVKNRFSTLRSHVPDLTENCNYGNRSHKQSGTTMSQQPRPPFTVLGQNLSSVNNLSTQHHDVKEISSDDYSLADSVAGQNCKIQGTFLKKDDPKITALMQQAELLSSLAQKVNTENTEQSLENAWKVLQDFLNRSKENDILRYRISDIDFQLEDFKDLIEDLRSSNDESHPSWRQPDLYESPASSEYSTGSTIIPHPARDKTDQIQAGVCASHQDIGAELQSVHIGESPEFFPSGVEDTNNDPVVSASSSTEFGSPIQVTPLFRSLAAGIPSPKFSESERNFLLRTLGIESPISPSEP